MEKALLVRVRSLQAALRAALGPRGKLLQLSPGDGQSASQGLPLQLANAGRGSVALVPYPQPLHGHLASSEMEAVSGDGHEAQEPASDGPFPEPLIGESSNAALVSYQQAASQGEVAEGAERQERFGDDGMADAPEPKRTRRDDDRWEPHMVGTIAVLKKGDTFKCPVPECTYERDNAVSILKHFVRHRDKRNEELAAEDEAASSRRDD